MDLMGYVELQDKIRSYLMTQNGGESLQPTYFSSKRNIPSFGKVMQRDIQNIQETIHLINDNMLQKAQSGCMKQRTFIF